MMGYKKLTAAWTLGLVATASVFAPSDDASAQSESQRQQGVNAAALNPENIDAYGEELLRGPVHEAFAEQYNQDPIAGVTIDRAPPPAVNEIPPEIRPEGDNVQWLSGYWFWDDDRSDFLWVSGTWRVIPPGQRWLPGYWAQSGGEYQWVSGSWVSTQQETIEYIAQSPPESLDNGPTGIAPSDGHFWIPGCWTWTQNDYAWRPGYWSAGYSNWVWVPQRYLWTPRGYVFYNGYWDYPIARRGTLFAPFYFNQPVYARSNFFYSPRVSILASLLQSHFWVRPQYHHYYFGDFYAANYRNVGIIPWHNYHRGVGFQSRRYSFDPLFVHANLYSRSGGVNFYQQINNQYNILVNQSDRRPSLTYRDQLQRVDRDRGRGGFNDDRFNRGPGLGDRNESFLGESIRELAQREPDRFTRLTTEQINRVRDQSRDVPNLISLRRQNETSFRGRDIDTRDRQSPGSDRPSSGRDSGEPGRNPDRSNRGADSLADRLQLPPVDRVRFGGDRQTASDPTRSEGRYSVGRPSTERPSNDRPSTERPSNDRPSNDRPSNDRPSNERPSNDRPSNDRPSTDRPSTDRPSNDRPSNERPSTDRPSTDRPSTDRPSNERPSNDRPSTDRPSTERPSTERPGIVIPGGERPSINRPAFERPGITNPGITNPGITNPGITNPGVGRPGIERPSRDIGSGSPLGGIRTGEQFRDQIRDRVPQGSRPVEDRGPRESGRSQPRPVPPNASQPRPTLPGVGLSPLRPQIGAPSTQPLRTPGFGDRSPGRLGSQMQVPTESGRPSLRSPLSSPSGRSQFTPQPGGGRPEAGPSVRGNRSGGDSDSGRGRGPGGGPRGKRD